MNRDASLAIVVGIILAAVVVAVGVGLTGTTKTTTSSGPSDGGRLAEPPADASFGVIYGLQATPGLNIAGLRLRSSKYSVQVAVIAPSTCLSTDDSGREELIAVGDCARLPVHGEVSGGGTTPSGLTLSVVTLEVSQRCFEALTIGEPWPSEASDCAA
jgi:hypothetical protein